MYRWLSVGLLAIALLALSSYSAGDGAEAANNGAIAYLGADGKSVWVVNPDGSNARRLFTASGQVAYMAWSPDGKRLAYTTDQLDGGGLFIYDTASRQTQNVRPNQKVVGPIAFFPDGRKLAALRASAEDFICFADAIVTLDTQTGAVSGPVADTCRIWGLWVQPDGQSLVYNTVGTDVSGALWRLPIGAGATRQATMLHDDPDTNGYFAVIGAALSPDGSQIAYNVHYDDSTEGNRVGIWLADSDGYYAWMITKDFSGQSVKIPSFSPDGTLLALSDRYYTGVQPTTIMVIGTDGSNPLPVATGFQATWQPVSAPLP